MKKEHNPQNYHSTYQIKLPLEISNIIEISDPVYTFCEVMDSIDLRKYLAVKESKTGRKRYNPEKMLKVILFAFMENGYASTREIEKYCKTDIRYMQLLDGHEAPSHKVRFNTNVPLDKKALDVLKSVDGQNAFIKNAVLSFHEQKQKEALVESIVAAVRPELSKVQTFSSPVPFQMTEPKDKDSAEESMDIADAFLDAL